MTVPKRAPIEQIPNGRFCFGCGPEIECFTACCQRLELGLTPWDILRLSRRTGMTTTEFLERHVRAEEKPGRLPRVSLMMNKDDEKCPFVSEEGCGVYEDRPGACRTYPLARAASPSNSSTKVKETYFVIREAHCKGFAEPKEWTVDEWLADQGMELYNELNDLWMQILARAPAVVQSVGADEKVKMFNMASYDLDKFRIFVFEGGLLDRLELPERFVEKLRTDDIELLRFAFSWLRLALFGEMGTGLVGRR